MRSLNAPLPQAPLLTVISPLESTSGSLVAGSRQRVNLRASNRVFSILMPGAGNRSATASTPALSA